MVYHVTKRGTSTIFAPQSQINNGASCVKKRGSSTFSASQPQINPTHPDPTILTSVGNSINGVHMRSSRRVSAVSALQSQMSMSSEPTTISDETSTDGAIEVNIVSAPKLFKKAYGKTRLASERALYAAGRNLLVTIKVEDRKPSGANGRFFVTEIGKARYNEMIALQKEQEGMDEAKRLSEKEICAKVLGKRSACAFSLKPTTREEEFEDENEQLKLELQEMKATITSVKDMQKVINQLQDFQKRIEGASPSIPTYASID